jgi:hypothetical protein
MNQKGLFTHAYFAKNVAKYGVQPTSRHTFAVRLGFHILANAQAKSRLKKF